MLSNLNDIIFIQNEQQVFINLLSLISQKLINQLKFQLILNNNQSEVNFP
jgi:hypothetical protein